MSGFRCSGKIKQALGLAGCGLLAINFAAPAMSAGPGVQDIMELRESYHTNGSARYIDASGLQGNSRFAAGSAEQRAHSIAAYYKVQLGLSNPERDLVVTGSKRDIAGNTHIRFGQRHQDIRVTGADLIVHFDRDGAPSSVTANVVPNLSLASADPALSGRDAARIARDRVAAASNTPVSVSKIKLVVYNDGLVRDRPGVSRLAFEVTVRGSNVREFVYVDAFDGSVLDQFTGIHTARNRMTYDMHGSSNYFTATLERSEGDGPTGDTDIDEAHDFSGDTYDFFNNAYGRDSLDDNGLALLSYTHYFSFLICPNAFWDGTRMTYCDGFPTDDVTAHEMTHGVTENTANLVYSGQSGALNESMSDIFGEAVDQINGAGTDTPAVKWLLGEDVPGFGAIRDMSNPPAFGDPDKVTSPNYYCGSADNGGVHTNSGVPNKNFALMVDGGTFNGRDVRALGLTQASAIHYQALTSYLGVNSKFRDYLIALWRSCNDLIGVELNDPLTGAPSGETLARYECVSVLRAGLAVELFTPAC